MRLIHSLRGTVAVRADEVELPGGIVVQDLLNVVGEGYHFAVRPQIQQATSSTPFMFQAGWLEDGNNPRGEGALVTA
jgi:hypothetical protein